MVNMGVCKHPPKEEPQVSTTYPSIIRGGLGDLSSPRWAAGPCWPASVWSTLPSTVPLPRVVSCSLATTQVFMPVDLQPQTSVFTVDPMPLSWPGHSG